MSIVEHCDERSIESLSEKVQFDHRLRLDLPRGELVPRPYVPRKSPQTAIIARAAAESIEAKAWAELGA